MNFDPNHFLGQAIFFAFFLWIIYRRFRRLFGRQELKRGRMKFRIVLLSVLGVFLLIPALLSQELAWALVGGLAVGVGLGVWGAKHTRFESKDGVLYYIPHTYAGMVVSALFLGRIIYRIAMVSHSALGALSVESSPGIGDFFGGMGSSPITYCIFYMLVGYYVYYYNYVLYESKHLKPGDYEKPAVTSAPGGNAP